MNRTLGREQCENENEKNHERGVESGSGKKCRFQGLLGIETSRIQTPDPLPRRFMARHDILDKPHLWLRAGMDRGC